MVVLHRYIFTSEWFLAQVLNGIRHDRALEPGVLPVRSRHIHSGMSGIVINDDIGRIIVLVPDNPHIEVGWMVLGTLDQLMDSGCFR